MRKNLPFTLSFKANVQTSTFVQNLLENQPLFAILDGEIWELRPIRDRILFARLMDGRFVLLHQFMKKTQKTPKREIQTAQQRLSELKERLKNE
nr:type II toxin-antitoxin system RelE/ParE family toxin [Haemophilus influenzae]